MTTPTTPVAAEVPDMGTKTLAALTANDRCDRCGAQAYVATAHLRADLLWCKHCFERRIETEAGPVTQADLLANFVVVDERHKLT